MTKQTRVTTDIDAQTPLIEPSSFVILPASALDSDESDNPDETEFEALEDLREHLRRLRILTEMETSIGPEAIDPRDRKPITLAEILDGTLILNDGSEYGLQDLLEASLDTGTGIRTSITELMDCLCEISENGGESWGPLAPYRGITTDLDGTSITVGDVLDGVITTDDGRTLKVDRDLWTGLLRLPGGHLATLSEVYELTPIPGAPRSMTLGELEINDAELVVEVSKAERTLRSIFDKGVFELPSGETLRIAEFSTIPMDYLVLSTTLMEIFDTAVEVSSVKVVIRMNCCRR